jgi:predicted Ser/Thr protein kinase
MIGQTISRYRLDETLGEGGVGVVYRAYDLRLGRTVAVKMLRPELASNPSVSRSMATEAHAASALNHPGIATLYDFETADGFTFLVYEYIRGRTLRDLHREGALTTEQVTSIFMHIADAVAAAHEAGIVHRDLKPENVMINEDGRVKILDFGLAKVLDTRDNRSLFPTEVTAPGLLAGTVAYMSPEQLDGDRLDQTTDIFSLGTMFYEMLTGKHPFQGRSPGSTIGNILKENPDLNDAGIPAGLERIIRKCIQKKKQDRYQSLREFITDLEALPSAPVDRGHRPAASGAAARDPEFSLSPRAARALFLLTQCGYLGLYAAALIYADDIVLLLPGLTIFAALIISAMCGIAVRLYLLSSVGFRHPASPRQFRRLFPVLLVLDSVWATSPLLLWPRIGYISLGCVAVMAYLPFSQRTLMYSAYANTRPSVINLRRE